MRRKLLIGAGVLLALVAVAVIALSVVVKTYLKSDKLKAIIIPKAEEFTGRTVELDRIDVSLFKGVVLKGLTVKEGQGDFVSVQEFVLAYDLLPLLRKQLVIRKIVLVSPQVRIMRLSEDRYNFSDILERASGGEGPAKEAKPEDGGLPVSIVAQRVVVEDARVEFADAMKEIPDFTARGDANLDISMEKGRPRAEGRVELKELSAELRGVRTEARGRLDITRDSLKADLATSVDGEEISLEATARDYATAPDVKFALKAGALDLEKLMALAGAAGKGGPGKEGPKAGAGEGAKGSPLDIRAAGTVDIKSAKYKELTVSDIHLAADSTLRAASALTGEINISEMKASMDSADLDADGAVTLDADSIRATLRTGIWSPGSLKLGGYTIEKLNLDASPDIVYLRGEEKLNLKVPVSRLTAAAVATKETSVNDLSFAGTVEASYGLKTESLSAGVKIDDLKAGVKGANIATKGAVSYDGKTLGVALKGARATAASLAHEKYAIKDLSVAADTDLKVRVDDKTPIGEVNIKTFSANINGMEIKSRGGKLKSDGKVARVALEGLTAKGGQFKLSGGELKDIDLAADADLALRVKDKAPLGGTLSIRRLKATLNGVNTGLAGKISATEEKASADLRASVAEDEISLTATASQYRDAPNVNFDVYSKRLDLNRLTALSGEKGKEAPAPQKPGQAEKKAKGEKPLKVSARGKIKVGKALYKDYSINGFSANVSYLDDAMTIDPVAMALAGGTSMVVDGDFKGNVSFRYPRGAADAPEVMKRTMSGKGASTFRKIQIKDVKVAQAIARLTSVEDLRNPTFTDSRFDYVIREQKVNIDGYMNSERIKFSTRGYVGLDKAIDMEADLWLDKLLARRLVVTQVIRGEDGSAVLPLAIRGTTEAPKVNIDAERVIKKEIDKRLDRMFERLLPKKTEEPQPATPQEQPPAEEPAREKQPEEQIKDLLKGIFGK
jgi:hypothetical protein